MARRRRVDQKPISIVDLVTACLDPGVAHFCLPVFNAILLTSHGEHMGCEAGGWSVSITRRKAELDATPADIEPI